MPYHALDVQALARVHEELAGGGVLWVVGSRGMSKAALLGELRRELSARGRLVLFGRGEKTVDAPYGALTEPLSQALQFLEARGTAEAFMDRHASALSVILPSLLSPAPRAPDKLAFLEALRALFFELSKEAPLSLLLADVHYVDDDTRDALRFLARHLFDPDVGTGDEDRGDGVLVMACRTDDEDGQALVGSVGTGPRTRTFVVESFGRDRLWQYLEHHPLLDRLLLASQGRPEDVDELLESLPRSTDDLLMRRLDALDDTSQRLVRALATIGRPAPADLLGSVAQATNMEASQRLGPLVEARLLARRLHNGELLFSFARPHHQEALLKNMQASQRQQLHGSIAAALEQRALRDNSDDASAQLLAHHFLQSDEPQRGVPYALAACESLLVTFAYGVVSRLVKQALLHAEGDHRFALLGHLVEAERRRGESAAALQQAQLLRAMATAEQLPSVLRRIGELLAERGECDEALFVLEEALALVVDSAIDDALPPRAEIRAAMAEVAFKKNDFSRAIEEARGALVQAQQPPTAFSLRVSNTLGKVELAQDRIAIAQQRFLDNLRIAEQHGLDVEARLARHNAGICHLRQGRLEEAQALFEHVLQSARAMGDLFAEAQALQNLGAIWQKGGNVGRALDAYRAALSRLVRVGNQAEVRRTTWNVSNLLCALGHYDDANIALDHARKGAERDASARALSFVSSTEGDLALFQERFADALEAYQRTRLLRVEVGEPSLLHETTLRVGMTALMLDDVEQAAATLLSLAGAELQLPTQLRRDVFAAALATFTEGNGHAALGRMAGAAAELTRQQSPDDAWRMHAWVALRAEQLQVAGVAQEARANAVGLIERSLQALPPAMAAITRADPLRARLLRGEPMRKVAVAEPVAMVMPIAAEALARRPEWDQVYAELIGESPALMRVLDRLDRLRRTRLSTVLIRGESGTGKELVAAAIHQTSERASGPFIRVNCAALVETLLMSELFGHEKGSFTGALARKIGRFELARGGTLFLDEIGDISAKTQVSLLRVLQEKQFERVGGTTTITTDAVVICATHRDLEDMVRQHAFREDLYYRLKGVVVDVPPLRERLGDLAMLAQRFLLKAKTELGRAPDAISEEALAVLTRHRWPGNIRELQNVVRSVALFCEHNIVQLSDLAEFPELFGQVETTLLPSLPWTATPTLTPMVRPPVIAAVPPPMPLVPPVPPVPIVPPMPPMPLAQPAPANSDLSLGELKRKLEFEAIATAIRQTGGNVTQAAALLKMKRPRLSQIINGNPDLKAVKDGLRSDDDGDATLHGKAGA